MFYWIRLIGLIIIDSVLVNVALYTSLLLRFDGNINIPEQFMDAALYLVPWWTLIALASMVFFKLYNRMWQYASLGELSGVIKAITSSMAALVILIYLIPLPYLPRSVYILTWLFAVILIIGSRLLWRITRNAIIKGEKQAVKRTLIVGAGDAGAMVARELDHNHALGLQAVGFVDDNALKQKLSIYGIPVLGPRQDIPRLVDNYDIEEIIIAMPSADGTVIRDIYNVCRQTRIKTRIFYGTDELLNGRPEIREIQLEDLLRRKPVNLNIDEIAGYIKDRNILVSGAGGSIGSELCRQICRYNPAKIILVEYSENNLFDIDNELKEMFSNLHIEAELCDVKDRNKLQEVFKSSRPQVVFHAAAYKHVPLMEKHPGEAIKNNILGTKNIVEISDKVGVDTFILISTDKAVNPTSVMGASKRIAEMVVRDFNRISKTKFASVRFGNVLGSRGSVVPTFKQQIQKGGPVTVTHPDMTRYFMTIPEAVQLVIQAGAITSGGETFILDMGEPVKIMDLARDMIQLYGYEPDKDIEIRIMGIRPGEKLYEELFTAREQMAATRHERIYIREENEDSLSANIIEKIEKLFIHNTFLNRGDVLKLISMVLPEYNQHKDLDIMKNDVNK